MSSCGLSTIWPKLGEVATIRTAAPHPYQINPRLTTTLSASHEGEGEFEAAAKPSSVGRLYLKNRMP